MLPIDMVRFNVFSSKCSKLYVCVFARGRVCGIKTATKNGRVGPFVTWLNPVVIYFIQHVNPEQDM